MIELDGPMTSTSTTAERALEVEARRVYRRYAIEVVEAYALCPYARRAREGSRTRELVLLGSTPSEDDLDAAVERLSDDAGVEIGLILLPRVDDDPRTFEHRVQALRRRHQTRRGKAVVALEAFHPYAEADPSTARRLIPFLRRTPDPTIQVARLAVLDRLREGRGGGTGLVDLDALEDALSRPDADLDAVLPPTLEPLHERIAENNRATFRGSDGERIRRSLDAILEDRDQSYGAIAGLEPPPPRRRR